MLLHWWAVALHDNVLRMYVDDNVIDKTQLDIPNVDQVMPAGAWNHIVAIRDREKDKLIIYINGLETRFNYRMLAMEVSHHPAFP